MRVSSTKRAEGGEKAENERTLVRIADGGGTKKKAKNGGGDTEVREKSSVDSS